MSEQKQFNELDAAMEAVSTLAKIHDTEKAKQNMQSTLSSLLKVSDDKVKQLDDVIAKYSLEELEKMTTDEINQLFIIDGHELDIDLDISSDKIDSFKRDFILYMKRTEIYSAELDASVKELETAMAEHDIEYNELIKKYGSMYLIIKAQMEEILKNPKDEDQELRASVMLKSIESAISLDVILDYIDQFNFENMLNDFHNRGMAIYKKHKVVLKRLGIKTDISRLAGVEELLGFGEEYKEFYNLAMFLVIRYIAYAKNPTKEAEGMFVSNLALVYRSLVEESMPAEDKERLQSAVKVILDKALSMKK